MRRLVLLAGLAALMPAACGGDEERRATSTETTNTTRSAPDTETQRRPAPARTVTAPPRTVTVPAPRRPKTTEDRPGHDTPPAKGSPEERFEKRCEKDPEACG